MIEIIAQQIWKNECNQTVSGLTSWNRSEGFASMGIGHFIWYPENADYPFQETFPLLVAFLQKKGVQVPLWITKKCPWGDRETFYRDFEGEKLKELRSLLTSTISLQAEFILERFEKGMEKVLTTPHVKKQYQRLMKSPEGIFAMIDYLNFKGDGLSEKERYQGVGWGLFQVLSEMKEDREPIDDFILSAKKALQRRVELSSRDEKRWLPGWMNRIETYKGKK